jgi:hypothetical protein
VFQQAEFFFILQCSHSSMIAAKLLLMMTRVIVTFQPEMVAWFSMGLVAAAAAASTSRL